MHKTGTPDETERQEHLETREWLESLDDVIQRSGPARVRALLRQLQARAVP